MRNIIFCQVSHDLVSPNDLCRDYYREVYQWFPGYQKVDMQDFMEPPTWIANIAGMLPSEYHRKSLYIIRDVEEAIDYLSRQSESELMFSVMDVNKNIIWEILDNVDNYTYLGGYVDFTPFKEFPNVAILDSPHALQPYFYYFNPDGRPDYSLFQGRNTIPRLSLSDGCLFQCSFCSIPRVITEYTWPEIRAQIESWWPLNYKLVYVNDKTFGQASNWRLLGLAGEMIRDHNPNFLGFVVQTTVTYADKHLEEWVDEYGIRYIEVGVEAPDNDYLRRMIKPYRMKHLNSLLDHLRHFDRGVVGFIPNLIFGLPGYDHGITLNWVAHNLSVIDFINPYILSLYNDRKNDIIKPEEIVGPTYLDGAEYTMQKSWLNDNEQQEATWVMKQVLKITS